MKLQAIFKDKTVLVTGHTGFKGAWLAAWLKKMGADVVGVSIGVPTNPSHFSALAQSFDIVDMRLDIRDSQPLKSLIHDVSPDFVFHLAAQALVKDSYRDPISTWSTNLMGTVNVLDSLRDLEKNCVATFITSDKCYDNVEWAWGYRETDRLGGPDPYSASKGAAEIAISSYVRSFYCLSTSRVRIASARAGNVVGGGDWGADRIVPDCVRSWVGGYPVDIRRPNATRPWQHVLEPLSGYLTLAANLHVSEKLHGQSFNFGPVNTVTHSVIDVVKALKNYWAGFSYIDQSSKDQEFYESTLLKLNCDKALAELSWRPVLDFEETLEFTAMWYKAFYENADKIIHTTEEQIDNFISLAGERQLEWAS